jgi:TRAP-type C4-dicarboxylate transport system substrate-binding protein
MPAASSPAYNLTLMPGLVKNHDHAARLNEPDFMEAIERQDGRG